MNQTQTSAFRGYSLPNETETWTDKWITKYLNKHYRRGKDRAKGRTKESHNSEGPDTGPGGKTLKQRKEQEPRTQQLGWMVHQRSRARRDWESALSVTWSSPVQLRGAAIMRQGPFFFLAL